MLCPKRYLQPWVSFIIASYSYFSLSVSFFFMLRGLSSIRLQHLAVRGFHASTPALMSKFDRSKLVDKDLFKEQVTYTPPLKPLSLCLIPTLTPGLHQWNLDFHGFNLRRVRPCDGCQDCDEPGEDLLPTLQTGRIFACRVWWLQNGSLYWFVSKVVEL